MRCHNCEVDLIGDGVSPVVICEICRVYRFTDIPDDSGNCIIPLNQAGDFHCPCCRRQLGLAAMEGLKVEHCAACSGVLMSSDLFAMYVRNRRDSFRETALHPAILVTDAERREMHCPGCRRRMTMHPNYGPDSIIIDGCLSCGMVWINCREAAESGHLMLHALVGNSIVS